MIDDVRQNTILIVEDDPVLNELIAGQLESIGFAVHGERSWAGAEAFLEENEPDLILLDVRLPDTDAHKLIRELSRSQPVIVITAYASVERAVEAMKDGAAEYLAKPINLEELEIAVRRALENAEVRRNLQFVKSRQRAKRKAFIISRSRELENVIELIDAVAPEETTVLIQGESGVGKELVALEIHERSRRADQNFVAIDCCTIQENLFESELFGHERGAFTGASGQKKGLIEGADKGTLFLDEIGEITSSAQAKLLRVIETGHFRRLGGVKDLVSNARIVAATNRNLLKLAEEGSFRADLYYRLSAFVIAVPPLRERREDIPQLAQHFIANHGFSRRISKALSPDTVSALVEYDWPGNVRELRNVIERALIISGMDETIRPHHLGLPKVRCRSKSAMRFDFDHEPTLEELKAYYLKRLLSKYAGRRAQLAQSLGISERNVYRLIKKYGLHETQH